VVGILLLLFFANTVTPDLNVIQVHNFDGNVYDGYGTQLVGVEVIAWVNSENRGSTTTANYGAGHESYYLIDVQGDDEDVTLGRIVSFTIDGATALESKAFEASGNEDMYHLHLPISETTTTTVSATTTIPSTTSTMPPTTTIPTTTTVTATTTTVMVTTVPSTTTVMVTTVPSTTMMVSTTTQPTIVTTLPRGRPSPNYLNLIVTGRCLEDEIKVDVRKSGARPLRGSRVSVYLGSQKFGTYETDSDGLVTFQPTKTGQYFIEAYKSGYYTSFTDITIVKCQNGPETCYDKIQNQDETGVDCGGVCPPCPTCYDGIQNGGETGIDCGGICGQCRASCSDGLKNQNEEGVDCGGVCPPCPTCWDEIQNQDETGLDCGGICKPCRPTCFDGIKNQDETGVDCGGSCGDCKASCNDGIKNQNEEDIDCGGLCGPCPTCFDGLKNGRELGVDCGGSCGACPPGTCTDSARNQNEEGVDCGGVCPACKTCFDGIKNQGETGVDCGGVCSTCPTCNDGILNQNEEAVDCGGICPPCVETCLICQPELSAGRAECKVRYWTGMDELKDSFCGEIKNLIVFTPSQDMNVSSLKIEGNPTARATISDVSGIIAKSIDYNTDGLILDNTVELREGDAYIIFISKPEDAGNCAKLMSEGRIDDSLGSWEVRDSWCDGIQNGCYLAVTLNDNCPTCFDGIQNQGETGVDCGGSCSACSPAFIGRVTSFAGSGSGWTYLLIGLLILAVALAYRKGQSDGKRGSESLSVEESFEKSVGVSAASYGNSDMNHVKKVGSTSKTARKTK